MDYNVGRIRGLKGKQPENRQLTYRQPFWQTIPFPLFQNYYSVKLRLFMALTGYSAYRKVEP